MLWMPNENDPSQRILCLAEVVCLELKFFQGFQVCSMCAAEGPAKRLHRQWSNETSWRR